ncbi:ATP-dependent RNA helicase [uncultured virus]|nr:ATP-dependent RNA helicase [uncultured virus]
MNDIKGILDPEGKNINPLTGKVYSDQYKELAKKWSKLPMYKRAKEFIEYIKNYQIILLTAETGAGKSILMPKLILHALDYKGKIVMTLPKQIITKTASEYGAATLDVELGKQVGYQYKGSPREMKSEETNILYSTDGSVVSMLLKDPQLTKYDCVIIDEAHERKINVDLLIYLLRETCKMRSEFKLIIMSATINAEIFRSYFDGFKYKEINVEGERLFPIKSIFLKHPLEYEELLKDAFRILLNILANDNPKNLGSHDILLFVTSGGEAFTFCQDLNNQIKKESKTDCKITCYGGIYCVELFAGIDQYRQNLAQDKELYKQEGKFTRKLVVSTNVGESSITINGIKFVIDIGYEFKDTFDPNLRAKRLDRKLISQAQSKQRMGRAGRIESGICYHMYTQNDFENLMDKFPEPTIRISDITGECLKLLYNAKSVDKLLEILTNFVEPPRENYIRSALTTLIKLGTILDNNISELGELVVEMNIDPMDAIPIIHGRKYKCLNSVLRIISILQACKKNLNDIFVQPRDILKKKGIDKKNYELELRKLNDKFNNVKNKFKHRSGDHISLLKIYEAFHKIYKSNKDNIDKWCNDNFIKKKTFLEATKNFKKQKKDLYKLIEKIDDIKIEFNQDIINYSLTNRILLSLLSTYKMNIATLVNNKFYKTDSSKDLGINMNRNSFLYNKLPGRLFYAELFILMDRPNLNINTIISKKLYTML